MSTYLLALALTIAVEIPCALLLLRRSGWRRVVAAALVANLVSHPLLHFVLPRVLAPTDRGLFTLVGEGGVLLLEALVYLAVARPRPWPLAVGASAVANAGSFLVGLCLF